MPSLCGRGVRPRPRCRRRAGLWGPSGRRRRFLRRTSPRTMQTSRSTTAPSAETTSWTFVRAPICAVRAVGQPRARLLSTGVAHCPDDACGAPRLQASSARQTRPAARQKSARLLGARAVSPPPACFGCIPARALPPNAAPPAPACSPASCRPRVPLPLHQPVAEDAAGVPPGQPGLGVLKVRPVILPMMPAATTLLLRRRRQRRRAGGATRGGGDDVVRRWRWARVVTAGGGAAAERGTGPHEAPDSGPHVGYQRLARRPGPRSAL